MKNETKVKELISELASALTEKCEPCPNGKPVLVTTVHRGVFFGYLSGEPGATVKLNRARNVLYWSADLRGFLGLADGGPNASCKVGPAVNIELRDITSIAECTIAAMKAFEAAPWAK